MVPVRTIAKHSRAVRHGVVRIAFGSLLASVLAPVWTVVAISPSPATAGGDCPSSIQAMVDRAKAGSRLELPACIVRETVVIDKPITLVGTPGAEIRGSDPWSEWTAKGAQWLSALRVPPLDEEGQCRPSVDCRSPEQVFVDDVAQRRVAADPGAGQFSLTPSRHVLLGSDPSGHLVEVSTRSTWMDVRATGVTIDGLTFRHAANAPQSEHGAVLVSEVDRFSLLRSHLFEAHGALLGIAGGRGHRIEDSELASAGQEGFAVTRVVDTVIARNQIHDNNTAGFDPFWEAGAGKATRVRGLTVEDNTVSDNAGPGLWCDIDCRDVTLSGNRADHNEQSGIFYEISTDTRIADNVLFENGWGRPDWGWGAGILVSSSGSVTVTGNVLAWNADGISVISQGRKDRPEGAGRNIEVSDNTIVGARQRTDNAEAYLVAWLEDWSGPLYEASSHNRGSGNRYWTSEREPEGEHFHWTTDLATESAFAQTPVGAGGAYLSLDDRDRILREKDIRLEPEEHVLPAPRLSRRTLWAMAVPAAIAGLAAAVVMLMVWLIRRRRRGAGRDL